MKQLRAFLCLALLPWFLPLTLPAEAAPGLTPRRVPAKESPAPLPAETVIQQVVVKFHEGSRVRLRGGELVVAPRLAREEQRLAALGLAPAQVAADLHELRAVLAGHRLPRGLERLLSTPESKLAEQRAQGEERSGRELADLDLYYRVAVPAGTKHAEVESLVAALNALPSVEIAYAEPIAQPPVDIAPATPSFELSQGYLDPAPTGIDARYAWTLPGGRGQGTGALASQVKVVDVEGDWVATHEDFPPLFTQIGAPTTIAGWRQHGTAVVGVLGAPDNGYGVTGIAHGARIGTSSFMVSGGNVQAIQNAIDAVGPGGIVLIELQLNGPATPNSPCGCSGSCCDCVPVENLQAYFDIISTATANGTIVVEAGANGATDLDDPVYQQRFQRSFRDSGAILVGAGGSGDLTPTCFTNYGSRIDVHGWGWNVTSTGYGSLFDGGGDENQFYTAGFSGTSSASPIVTGAAASLQGMVRAAGRPDLSPLAMRQLLRDTGTPQAADPRAIGPLPNLRAASEQALATGAIFLSQTVPNPMIAGQTYPVSLTVKNLGTQPWSPVGPVCNAFRIGSSNPQDNNTWGRTRVDLTAPLAAGAQTTVNFTVTAPATAGTYNFQWRMVQECVAWFGNTSANVAVAVQNVPPVARFTFQCTGLGCTFDASGSTDNVGISSYAWSFGDATSGSGVAPAHAYAAMNAYPVTLTVTDTQGLTHSLTRTVSVQPVPSGAAQSYFAVPLCRVLDTRTGTILGNGVLRTVNVAGLCTVPATAKAVAATVTVVSPSGAGYLAFYPEKVSANPFPHSEILFDPATSPRASNAILALEPTGLGTVNVLPAVAGSPGQVHLVLDVVGYFTDNTRPEPGAVGPLGYQTLNPCRIADTRSGAPILAGTSRDFTAQGVCGLPLGATAAALNAVVIGPTADGLGTLYQAGVFPPVPTLAFKPGDVLSNGALVQLAPATPDVSFHVYSPTAGATSHVAVDAYGYFQPAAPLRYRPLTSCRAVDTRAASQGAPALAAGVARSFAIRGGCGVPTSAKAVAVSVATVGQSAAGYLAAYPGGTSLPLASFLTFAAGNAITNGGILPLSTQAEDLSLYASAATHVIVDVHGYFE